MTRKILSLDLSIKNTGWCSAIVSPHLTKPTLDFGDVSFQLKPKERKFLTPEQIQGEQLMRFARWFRASLLQNCPDEICLEKGFLNQNPSTEILLMIRGVVLLNARYRDIPVYSYATSSLKAYALVPGYNKRHKELPAAKKRAAIKQEMVEAMQLATGDYTSPISDDIADSYHCLHLHLERTAG